MPLIHIVKVFPEEKSGGDKITELLLAVETAEYTCTELKESFDQLKVLTADSE